MFKRILLTLTFIAAFSTVGIGLSNQAQAWRGGYYGRPYGAYYAPRAVYYGPAVVPYRAYYAPARRTAVLPGLLRRAGVPGLLRRLLRPPAGVSVSVGY